MKPRRGAEAALRPRRICSIRSAVNLFIFSVALFILLVLQQIPDPIIDRITQRSMDTPTKQVDYTSRKHVDSSVRFVMFLGLEGTGHHFWQDLVNESPIYERLKALGLHPKYTKRLTQALYRHKNSRWKGLWSSPCKWQASDPTPNVTAIQEDLVSVLCEMNDHLKQLKSPTSDPSVVFPVNFLGSGNEFGVASYPSFLKPCRTLQYPNLDVWYDACDRAKVLCEHIYIFRDPYSVIRSTTDNRPINKDKLEAIHLYTTQLQILHSQLLRFPNHLVGCWNYDAAASSEQWKDEIEPILNFQNEEIFQGIMKEVFRPKPILTERDKMKIVPADFQVYMSSFVSVHETLVRVCKDIKESTL